MDVPTVETTDEGVRFTVRLCPRASREGVLGVLDGAVKVAVTAPPVDGKANAALIGLLGRLLSIPKRDIRIVGGHGSRLKTLVVRGIDSQSIRQLLGT